MGARCRKAGRGGGGMPSIVSGGGPMSEHSTQDVLKCINRSTPLAMLVSCKVTMDNILQNCERLGSETSRWIQWEQGRHLGGAPGALAPGADFEGAPKRRSPTGHTLICSTVAWWFPHLQTKRVANDFFKIWFYWLYPILMFFGVYICIFTLYFMFIVANIVCCRLRHQDARCTPPLVQ
jgi:hypothetical protein